MSCAIEEKVFKKVAVVFEPKFFGYTGYTSSGEYTKTIKTINFANSANKYIGYTGFTGFTGYGEPTEYTNSSDKPYHYPCKDILKDASEIITEIKKGGYGYTGYTSYSRPAEIKPNGYTGGREYQKYLKEALNPIVGYTGSSNWVDLVKYGDSSKHDLVHEATPEEPKNTLWQVIQIMIFEYICSINNRYDLNIPLDIVG